MRNIEMQIALGMESVAVLDDEFVISRQTIPRFAPAPRQKVGKKRYTERRAKAKAAKQARKRNRGSK